MRLLAVGEPLVDRPQRGGVPAVVLPHAERQRVVPVAAVGTYVLPRAPGQQPPRADRRRLQRALLTRRLHAVRTGVLHEHRPTAGLVASPPVVELVAPGRVEVVDEEVELDELTLRDGVEAADQGRRRQERETAVHLDQPLLPAVGGLAGQTYVDPHVDQAPQHQDQSGDQADQDALDEVEREHAGDGEPVDPQLAAGMCLGDVGGPDQAGAHHDQQPSQGRERDLLHQPDQDQGEEEHPDAVQDRGRSGAGPGRDVGRAAHDDAGDGEAAESSRNRVGQTLSDELAVEVAAPAAVQLVDGDRGEQALHARDQGHGQHRPCHREGGALRQRDRADLVEQIAPEMDALGARQPGGGEQGDRDDRDQLAGHRPDPLGQPRPDEQDADHADPGQHGVDVGLLGVVDDVLDVLERAGLRPAAEGDVELAEDDGDPDRGEHGTDHGRGDCQGVAPEPGGTEHDLEETGHQGDRAGRLPPELGHRLGDDDGEAGGRAADLQWGAAEEAGDDAARRSGDQACGDRCTGGDGDAERERHGDEEDDQRGRYVEADGLANLIERSGPA